jgi:hypothetical protein
VTWGRPPSPDCDYAGCTLPVSQRCGRCLRSFCVRHIRALTNTRYRCDDCKAEIEAGYKRMADQSHRMEAARRTLGAAIGVVGAFLILVAFLIGSVGVGATAVLVFGAAILVTFPEIIHGIFGG